MINYYYIILLIITGLASSAMTLYYPTLKWRYKRYKTRHKREMRDMVKQEVERQLKQILND